MTGGKEHDFRPAPGKLNEIARRLTEGDAESRGQKAWEYLLDFKYELMRGEKKMDEETKQALRVIGGFDALTEMTVDEKHFVQKRFVEYFASKADNAEFLKLGGADSLKLEAGK